MTTLHKDQMNGVWAKRTPAEQFANIGSEVFRAINWRDKNIDYTRLALYRALDLIDLSLEAKPRDPMIKELTRLRETLVDYFAGDNIYHSTDASWQSYFNAFTWAAARERGLA